MIIDFNGFGGFTKFCELLITLKYNIIILLQRLLIFVNLFKVRIDFVIFLLGNNFPITLKYKLVLYFLTKRQIFVNLSKVKIDFNWQFEVYQV